MVGAIDWSQWSGVLGDGIGHLVGRNSRVFWETTYADPREAFPLPMVVVDQ